MADEPLTAQAETKPPGVTPRYVLSEDDSDFLEKLKPPQFTGGAAIPEPLFTPEPESAPPGDGLDLRQMSDMAQSLSGRLHDDMLGREKYVKERGKLKTYYEPKIEYYKGQAKLKPVVSPFEMGAVVPSFPAEIKQLQDEYKARMAQLDENRPKDAGYRPHVDFLIEELSVKGLIPKGYFSDWAKNELAVQARDAITKYYVGPGYDRSLLRVLDAGVAQQKIKPEEAIDLRSQVEAGIITQVLLRAMPSTPAVYSASALIGLRTVAQQQIKRFSEQSEANLRAAADEVQRTEEESRTGVSHTSPQPKSIRMRESADDIRRSREGAIEILSKASRQNAVEIRAIAGIDQRRRLSDPFFEERRGRAAGMIKEPWAETEPGYGRMTTPIDLLRDFSPESREHVRYLRKVLGPTWSDQLSGVFSQGDRTFQMLQTGTITDGVDFKHGTLAYNPKNPQNAELLDLTMPDSVAGRLALLRQEVQIPGGPAVSTYEDYEQVAEHIIRESGGVGADVSSDDLWFQVAPIASKLMQLDEKQRAFATIQVMTPEPGKTAAELPGEPGWVAVSGALNSIWDVLTTAKNALVGIGEDISELPVIRHGTRAAAGIITDDPEQAQQYKTPASIIRILPRLLSSWSDIEEGMIESAQALNPSVLTEVKDRLTISKSAEDWRAWFERPGSWYKDQKDLDTYSKGLSFLTSADKENLPALTDWLKATWRLTAKGVIGMLAGTGDWMYNSPDQLLAYSVAGIPSTMVMTRANQALLTSRFATAMRVKRVLSQMATKGDKFVFGGAARQLRTLVSQAPARAHQRMAFLAGHLETIAQKVRAGQNVSSGLFKLVGQEIFDVSPDLKHMMDPTSNFFRSMLDPMVAKQAGASGGATRMLDWLRRKGARPLKPKEGTAFTHYMRQVSNAEQSIILDRLAADPPALTRMANLTRQIDALRGDTKQAARFQALQAERDTLMADVHARAALDLDHHNPDFDSIFAALDDVSAFAGTKRLRRYAKEAGMPIEQLVNDATDVRDYIYGQAAKYYEHALGSADVAARQGEIYGALREMLRQQADDTLGQAKFYTEHGKRLRSLGYQNTAGLWESHADKVHAKAAQFRKHLSQIEEEMVSLADRPWSAGRKIPRESVIWEYLDRKNPLEIADLIERRPDLWSGTPLAGTAPRLILEGVDEKAKGQVIREILGSIDMPSMAESTAELVARVKHLPQKALSQAEKGLLSGLTIDQVAEPGFWSRFTKWLLPSTGASRMYHTAANNAALQKQLQVYKATMLLEQVMDLSDEDRMLVNRALVLREEAAVWQLAKKDPSLTRDVVFWSQYPQPTGKTAVLARDILEYEDYVMRQAVDAGRITAESYKSYTGRPYRETKMARLHERHWGVEDTGVRVLRRELRQSNSPGAVGVHSDLFDIQQDPNHFRLNRWTKAGVELNEHYKSRSALLGRVEELWGKDTRAKAAAALKPPGGPEDTVRLKSPMGDNIGVTKPIKPDRLAYLDFAGPEEQAALRLTRLRELVDDVNLIGFIDDIAGVGGHVLAPEEFQRLFDALPLAARNQFTRAYQQPVSQTRPLNLGKYSNHYFSRDLVAALADRDRIWEVLRTVMDDDLSAWQKMTQLPAKIASPIFNAAKTSFIMLRPGTWQGNVFYNVYLDQVAGTQIYDPRTMVRNSRLLRQFGQLHKQGKIHPLHAEIVEHLGLGTGMVDFDTDSLWRKVRNSVMGLYDQDGLLTQHVRLRQAKTKLRTEKVPVTDPRWKQIDLDLTVVGERLKSLEADGTAAMVRKLGQEISGYWSQAPTKWGETRSEFFNAIRRKYNSIDDWTKQQAYLNLRLDKGMTPKGAAWYVRTFFQDYANVPGTVRALSRKPIFGSLVTSFPYELGRLTFNHLRYSPMRNLAVLSAVPAWNAVQLAKAGVDPERFMQQLVIQEGSWAGAAKRFTTSMLHTQTREPDYVLGWMDLTNVALPIGDMFEPYGLIGAAFNRIFPEERRGALGTLAAPFVAMASRGWGSAPVTNMAVDILNLGDRRQIINYKRADALDYLKAFAKGLTSKFVWPFTPYLGSFGIDMREALDAGERMDIGGPYSAQAAENVISRGLFNIPLRGKTPVGDAIRAVYEKASGRKLIEPRIGMDDETTVMRAVSDMMPDTYGGGYAEYSPDTSLRRLALKYIGETDPKKIDERKKEFLDFAQQMLPNTRGMPKEVEALKGMKRQEIARYLDNLEGQSPYTMFDRLPGIDFKTAVLVRLEAAKAVRPETLDRLVEVMTTRISSDGSSIIESKFGTSVSDPQKADAAIKLVERRIKERGGKAIFIPELGIIEAQSQVRAYRTLWPFLVLERNRLLTPGTDGMSPDDRFFKNLRIRRFKEELIESMRGKK